jgi:hypothetical protein
MYTGSGEASRAGSGPLWIWQLGLRGRSPNRLGINLSVDHEDLPRRTATSRRAKPRWRRSRRAGGGSERRGQAGWRLDSERTAPVKANQRLTVANPRPRRHWAAKVISASGKPVRHPHATTFLKRPAEMSQKCTARGEQNPMKTKQFRIGRLATLGQVIKALGKTIRAMSDGSRTGEAEVYVPSGANGHDHAGATRLISADETERRPN